MNNYATFNRYTKVGKNSFALGHKNNLGSYLLFSRLSDRFILTCVIDYDTKFKMALPLSVTFKQALNKADAMLEIFKAENVTFN